MKRAEPTMTGDQLREWRERHSLTPDAAALALGVSRRTFFDYQSGGYPIPQTVALLCAALDRLARKKPA